MARSALRPPAGNGWRGCQASQIHIAPLDRVGTLRLPVESGPLLLVAEAGGGPGIRVRHTTLADAFNRHGFGTLQFDLLSSNESSDPQRDFGVLPLAERLVEAVRWIVDARPGAGVPFGLFAEGMGTAVALVAAAKLGKLIGALVLCDGRPDLAAEMLEQVHAPTLLIVAGADPAREFDRQAFARLPGAKALEVAPQVRHVFVEPAALEMVVGQATRWFAHYLHGARPHGSG